MLSIVANQIVQGKAVMGCDKVDAVKGLSSIPQVKIGAAGDPGREGRNGSPASPPEAPYVIPETVIPFGPSSTGKDADLVLFNGDPFEYVTRVCAVIINGEVVSDVCR